MRAIDQVSKLHVLKPQNVKRSYNEKKELGLFHLFLTNTFITQNIRQWTNSKLKGKYIKKLRKKECLEVVGLELGSSFIGMNRIADIWRTDQLCGHPDFA